MKEAVIAVFTAAVVGCSPSVPNAPAATVLKGAIAVSYQVGGVYQIFVVSSDGDTRIQLTHATAFDSVQPAWSPDGTRIAYVARHSGRAQIRVMTADGSSDQPVTAETDPRVNLIPRWSRDGSRIFYTSGEPGPNGDPILHIWVMRADGSGKEQLTSGSFADIAPAPSPTGAIAFSSNRGGAFEIWSIASDGSHATRLTRSTTDAATGFPIEDKVPAWSPDGARIAYWRGIEMDHLSAAARAGGMPSATDLAIFRSWHIWVMDADGGHQRELTQGDDPGWSSDSTMVLHPTLPIYGADPQPSGSGEPIGVGVTKVDGTGRRLIFTVPPPGPSGYSWRPVP